MSTFSCPKTSAKIEIFRRSTGFRGDTVTSGEPFIVHGVALSVDDIYGAVTT
jgi:hypothetical protein